MYPHPKENICRPEFPREDSTPTLSEVIDQRRQSHDGMYANNQLFWKEFMRFIDRDVMKRFNQSIEDQQFNVRKFVSDELNKLQKSLDDIATDNYRTRQLVNDQNIAILELVKSLQPILSHHNKRHVTAKKANTKQKKNAA